MKKLLLLVAVTSITFVGGVSANAAAKIQHPESFIVTREDNQIALDEIRKVEIENDMTIDLSRSPVPIENLTTQVPEEAKNYKMMFNNRSVLQRASAKVYAINSKVNGVIWDPTYAAGQGIKCDYLVPVNFVGRDNAIPCSAVNVSGYSFSHIGGLLTDSTEGGIGDGGYYWRLFYYRTQPGGYWVPIWLSAWNWNHLVYG